MTLPSINRALSDAFETLKRFPLVILNAVTGTICALILIEFNSEPGPTILFPILFGTVFGLPLLTGVTLTAERWKLGKVFSAAVQSAAIVMIVLYASTVPWDLTNVPAVHAIRLLMFSIGALLLGISVPFLKDGNETAFWNFSRSAVVRVFTSGLFAIVLWGGTAIAMAALNNLFGIDFPEKRYGELWVFIVGIFSVWFFLAGIPKQMDLETSPEYPKGLRILSQYILIPLVFTYFVILYLYIGKIMIAWSWPHGWVSRLILGFAAAGITANLLVHPIKDHPDHSWIKTSMRWFTIVIIPMAVMLTLAVWQRVSEYGITEGRYLGFAAAAWMVLFAVYSFLRKGRHLLFIPFSLGVAVWLVGIGPWGMSAVSEMSQVNRLKKVLTEQRLLTDGTIRRGTGTLPSEAAREINALIDYLSELHGFRTIQPWFTESLLRDTSGAGDAYKEPAAVAALIGIPYTKIRYGDGGEFITLSADRNSPMDIRGYDRLLRGRRITTSTAGTENPDDGISYRAEDDLNTLVFVLKNSAGEEEILKADVRSLCDALVAGNGNGSSENTPSEQLTVTVSGNNGAVKIFLNFVRLERKENSLHIVSIDANIAYRLKNK